MAESVVTVCSRCGSTLRRCSPRCQMGGWVHLWSERHLCDPGMAAWMLANPRRWDLPWAFAHARRVEVIPQENWPIRKKR